MKIIYAKEKLTKQSGYICQLQESDQILLNIFLKFDLFDQNFPTLVSQLLILHVRHQKEDMSYTQHEIYLRIPFSHQHKNWGSLKVHEALYFS